MESIARTRALGAYTSRGGDHKAPMTPQQMLTHIQDFSLSTKSGKNGTSARFRWVKAPTHDALTQLTHSIAQRTAHYLERQGLLERDGENSFLTCNAEDEGPMDHLQESSITYRMAAGPQQGRKVFTLQTLPDCESDNSSPATVGVFAPNSKYRSMVTPARRGKRRSTTQLLRPTKLLQKNGLQ